MVDNFGYGAVSIGNDRSAAGHCFYHDESKRLRPVDREQECRGIAEEVLFFGFTDFRSEERRVGKECRL